MQPFWIGNRASTYKARDLPRIIEQKIAAELIRLRFEMTALRQVLERRSAAS
jgi:hypothetical protein